MCVCGGGGLGNSENLESGMYHRLRKCLDAFYNDSRGRKQNLLVKR